MGDKIISLDNVPVYVKRIKKKTDVDFEEPESKFRFDNDINLLLKSAKVSNEVYNKLQETWNTSFEEKM